MLSTSLRYDRLGTGRPLVLLHGLGSRRQVWNPLLDRLTPQRDVTAVDLPGFGASPAGGAGTVAALADAVSALTGALGLDRPAFGGSSLGGAVALELGARGKACSVTVFSPVGFFGAAGVAHCKAMTGGARLAGSALSPLLPRLMSTRAGRTALCGIFFGHPSTLAPDDCVADARALIAAPGFAKARQALGEWRLTECPPELDKIPVTVAWGTNDLVLPYAPQAARARRVLPVARHVRLPGCGHLPFADDPATCARLLLEAP